MNLERLLAKGQQLNKKGKTPLVYFSDGVNVYAIEDIQADGLRTGDGEESVIVLSGKRTAGKIG